VLDFGIYAIIIPNLVAGFIVIFLAMYFSSYFPRIYFRFNHIKRSTNFGASTLICNVFNYISNNIVNFTMVKIWGTNILGEYILAYNSTQMGYSALITPLHNSLFPILKNISNKKDLLRESINKLTHFQGIFIAPLIILSIYAMPDIIPIIYGEKWKFLIPIIQIMLVTSVFQCLMPPSNNILFAIGLPEISAKFSILRAIMYIAAISVAIINKFDVIFVTILLASINILIILLLAFATLIEINYSPFKFLIFIKKALLLSLSISLILYASDVYAKKILFNQNNFIVLCIGILYITTYLSIFCKEEIKQVSGKLKSLGFLKSEI
jgi:lipopolysaccharide exporter